MYGGSPVGGAQAQQAHYQSGFQAQDHSNQMATQGQALSHQVTLQENQNLHQSAMQWNQQQHELRMQREYMMGMGALNGDPANGQMPWPFSIAEGTRRWIDDLSNSGINMYDPRSLWGDAPNQR